ncbi:MAG TPA: class I SAM-dependent methyltransferase [Caulobacteraceae bacterium]|jgi:SAM-dependent methyltransferase|nr:class I SAM-dependent methyltransferase [Caulobacteraceae bacterium]
MAEPPTFQLVQHSDGWRRIDPTPSAEDLATFYAREYYQDSHGTYEQRYSEAELEHRRLLACELIHALEQARGRPASALDRLLEIGCGEGFFLRAASDAGFEVQGLEFSDFGLRAQHPELLPKVRFGDAFTALDGLIAGGAAVEVCVMEHVLEHVADPEGLLARLPRLLGAAGVVAITAPNDFSPVQTEARALGLIERDFWIAPPQHLNYFDTQSLPRLLERLGFVILDGFSSFPIDWFLHHPGSNYVAEPAAGKPAHQARMRLDRLLARNGVGAFHGLGQALFRCGAGRSFTVIARTPA